MRSLTLLVAGVLSLLPAPGAAQLVIRDDSAGWAWVSMLPNRRGVASLAYANAQTAVQGRLNDYLLADLAAKGVGRVTDSGAFDAAVSQVVAECTATDRTPPNATEITYAVHAEVAYWDHTRLAATEIFESITIAAVPPAEFRPDTYVQACTGQIANVLVTLGLTPD
ncbi:MAG: hypothetical protein AB7T31_15780 [Gemmatimonadales bacterium]